MEFTYIEKLIAKELLGESLDTEEQQTLENWLKQSAENKAMYERIRQNQFSRSHYESYFQINEKEAFQQFLKQTKNLLFQRHISETLQLALFHCSLLVPLFGSIIIKRL